MKSRHATYNQSFPVIYCREAIISSFLFRLILDARMIELRKDFVPILWTMELKSRRISSETNVSVFSFPMIAVIILTIIGRYFCMAISPFLKSSSSTIFIICSKSSSSNNPISNGFISIICLTVKGYTIIFLSLSRTNGCRKIASFSILAKSATLSVILYILKRGRFLPSPSFILLFLCSYRVIKNLWRCGIA